MAENKITSISVNNVKYDLNALPDGGTNGQVLTKTDDGAQWSNNVNFWKGTLEEYNKITEKDDDCIYFVVGDDYENE